MEKETSAGAVIYKIVDNQILYLIEYMGYGHISLVKGHVENNESLEITALREIKEETNLDVDLDTAFCHKISYNPYPDNKNIVKDVYFFVAKVKDNSIIPEDKHDNEVIKSVFLPYDEAYDTLTYDSDKGTLKDANDYIVNKEGFK